MPPETRIRPKNALLTPLTRSVPPPVFSNTPEPESPPPTKRSVLPDCTSSVAVASGVMLTEPPCEAVRPSFMSATTFRVPPRFTCTFSTSGLERMLRPPLYQNSSSAGRIDSNSATLTSSRTCQFSPSRLPSSLHDIGIAFIFGTRARLYDATGAVPSATRMQM